MYELTLPILCMFALCSANDAELKKIMTDESLRDFPGQNLFMGKELTGSFPHPRPIGKSIGNYPERLSFPTQNVQARKQPKVSNMGMVPPPNQEFQHLRENFNPSAGMLAYWGEEDDPKIKMKNYVEKLKTNAEMSRNVLRMKTTPKPRIEDTLSPKVDDYESPIRWVPINSTETRDGLARVTDPKTGKNRQHIVNGTVYVPIADYATDSLELSTPPTNKSAAITPAIDWSKVTPMDWLAHELRRPKRSGMVEQQCDLPSCETGCSGDTCAAGCTANSCYASCNGPGCKAMCIG
ncbi:uncharacterized protein LOC121737958 isoform X2 [Aricia agestis]|uniref:uncharacterized protein LOC121737958 isoform X2 n=1 Tax=Aricia agestis TaxID=91739 RepID=UPI001C20C13A|nr:uncharacterized protein LOC121737958 isoform X2 [Aricia agestis]